MTIDLHCHPALKSYLFENSIFSPKLQNEHSTSKGINYLRLQVDIPNMKKGGVQAAIAAHYIPEIGLIEESSLLKGAADLITVFWQSLVKKIEKADNGQAIIEQTLESIRIFEEKVNSAQDEKENAAIAHSFGEFENYINDDKIVFLHSVEGGHCLGRNLKSEDYLKNLDILFDKGVCMLTLGHFYENDLVSPTEGIPPSQRIIFDKHVEKDLQKGLTSIGEEVVRRMIDKGILIDMVHSTPSARKRIFEINDEYGDNRRPLIFSHSGVMDLFENEKHSGDKHYSPDRDEILKIKECNGVIGIIFMNYWLSGHDEKFVKYEPGMEYVFNTIQMIHSVTNSYDNIAIGTDFDAVNNPSDDLFNHSFIPKLMEYLSRRGISESNLEKIKSGNAVRVLKEGWGK